VSFRRWDREGSADHAALASVVLPAVLPVARWVVRARGLLHNVLLLRRVSIGQKRGSGKAFPLRTNHIQRHKGHQGRTGSRIRGDSQGIPRDLCTGKFGGSG